MGWNDLIGMRLDQYEILDELGRGGTSRVYHARDTTLNRDVAIKVIPNDADDRALFINRFVREVEAVQQLHHPNIVAVSGAGENDEYVYLVMQCVTGGTLRRQLVNPLSVPVATAYMVQIARALQHAHERGIIHRDVKPSNMLLEAHGSNHLLLTDFGIAKIQGARGLTKSGTTIGTPEYMSPEQAEGREIDQRSDIYALGCVLYETLAGRPPFLGSTPVSVLFQHVHSRPAYIRGFNPGVPAELVSVLEIALAKRPDERYGSAESFARALLPFAGEMPNIDEQPPEGAPIVIARSRGLTPSRPLPPELRLSPADVADRDTDEQQSLLSSGGLREETTAPLPAISARKTDPPIQRLRQQSGPPSRRKKSTLPPLVPVRRIASLRDMNLPLKPDDAAAAVPLSADAAMAEQAKMAQNLADAGPAMPLPPLSPTPPVADTPPGEPIPLRTQARTLRSAISGPMRLNAEAAQSKPESRPAATGARNMPDGRGAGNTHIAAPWPPPRKPRARYAGIAAAAVVLVVFGWLALNASGLGIAFGGKAQPTVALRQTTAPTAALPPTVTAGPTRTAGPQPTATLTEQQVLNQRAFNSFRSVTLASFGDGSCSGANYRSSFGSGQTVYVNLCTSGYAISAPMTVVIRQGGQVLYRMVFGRYISPSSSYYYYTNHPFGSGTYDVLVTLNINGTVAVARDLTLNIN